MTTYDEARILERRNVKIEIIDINLYAKNWLFSHISSKESVKTLGR